MSGIEFGEWRVEPTGEQGCALLRRYEAGGSRHWQRVGPRHATVAHALRFAADWEMRLGNEAVALGIDDALMRLEALLGDFVADVLTLMGGTDGKD